MDKKGSTNERIFLLTALLTPIALYIFNFGFGLWSTHDNWAKMGSALGGIYSAIFAFLAYRLLATQKELLHNQVETQHNQFVVSRTLDSVNNALQAIARYIEENPNILREINSIGAKQFDGFLKAHQVLFFNFNTIQSGLIGLRSGYIGTSYEVYIYQIENESSAILGRNEYLKLVQMFNQVVYLKKPL
ncbi:hypothetical protein [Pseudoalteromonas sp. Of11M-6]|uniref:hypothetical protein n=1 Tax=Pseudoalteromonas sp. Of11M-6 TaxID=2917754 RepID=UPI001EF72D01|nr:hypothetical protein [Pseudoalteromonas sp. Of11M-6]MCG7553093.1 hypothetical protein [Pseudoalteromonas sp. Of11M-6]